MSIDLTQFHQAFFDESREGVDVMESELLALDTGNIDPETINTVFRAAHSIKGGAGTFGFGDVAAFTHLLEAILDEMRNNERSVDTDLVDVLLAAIDCLRALLDGAQGKDVADPAARAEVEGKLRSLLTHPPGDAPAPVAVKPEPDGAPLREPMQTAVPAQPSAVTGSGVDTAADWEILFRPHPDMLKTGNDPLRMFKELDRLGKLDVNCDTSGLPQLTEMDPETSYLAWNLSLRGTQGKAGIDDAFVWVEDECDLDIQASGKPESNVRASSVTPITKIGGGNRGKPATDQSDISTDLAQSSPPPANDNSDDDDQSVETTKGSKTKAPAQQSSESESIRVNIDKIDALINIVGELVITQSMLNQFNGNSEVPPLDQLYSGLSQLESNARELQESVLRIRMLPISFVFSRFPRMVRDISRKLDKSVNLEVSGEQTELDKTVLEKIGDPMVHLVRNAIDHGIETREKRARDGKPETGTVRLHAYHEGGNIIAEVSDDGAGLDRQVILDKARSKGLLHDGEGLTDEQVFDCIFEPGFSTRDKATDLSGRGVGMDVVRRNINSLGGSVGIRSVKGEGTTILITLPLTLAIMEGQSAAVGDEYYIIPLVSIVESRLVKSENVNRVAGGGLVVRFRDEHLPVIRLSDTFHCKSNVSSWEEGIMIIVEGHGRRVGLFVDQLLGQQQAVVKSLEDNYRKIVGISGATVMGDGSVALILDIPGLIRMAYRQRAA